MPKNWTVGGKIFFVPKKHRCIRIIVTFTLSIFSGAWFRVNVLAWDRFCTLLTAIIRGSTHPNAAIKPYKTLPWQKESQSTVLAASAA